MALVCKNNGHYIKVDEKGNFEFYPSLESRARIKSAVDSAVIIAKYQEIIKELEADEERRYYDSENFSAEYDPWLAEFQRYLNDLSDYNYGKRYPLMQKYYPNVSDSIPEIIEAGSIYAEKATIEDMYIYAKEKKYWGDTEDA